MKTNNTLILFFLFVLSDTNLLAQDIKFNHLLVKDGLSQGWVRSICQDRQGFLWFGTGDGLDRFDGYECKVYKNSPSNKNSLSNNNIKKVYEDSKGNLWIGTHEGLNLYNRQLDIIQPISSTSQFSIEDISTGNDGNILIASPVGLFSLNVSNYSLKLLIPNAYVNTIYRDRKSNIWLGTFNGLFLVNTNEYSYKPFRFDELNHDGSIDNNIRSICQDKQGRFWLGTNSSGLILMEFKNDHLDKPFIKNFFHKTDDKQNISPGAILSIIDDQNGKLWIGIENGGLNIIDLKSFCPDRCIFSHFFYNLTDNSSISDNSIHSIYRDNQNTIWIGTCGNGVSYYNKLAYKFKTVRHIPYDPNSITDNHVNVLYKEAENLWIGTEGGLDIWNKRYNTFKHYRHNPKDINSLGANSVWSVFRDSRENVWIGTWAGGLDLMNEKSGTFTHFSYDPKNEKSIGGGNIFRIIEDRDRKLWIASMIGGLNEFDYKTKTFKRYQYDSKKNSLSNNWVDNLMEYGKDEIWISTNRAVDIYNKKTGKFTSFRHNPADKKSISYNGATVLFKDSRNSIWIGTEAGLNLFNRTDSTFRCYRDENGLPNNTINGIVEDDHGNLWLSTNKGITKFINGITAPEKPVFKNFDVSDGLQGNEFIHPSYCKDPNGYIYFGGNDGFNVFHPDSLAQNSTKPKVVITNLMIFNKPAEVGNDRSPLKKIISLTSEITLTHRQSVFTLEYAALNYIAPEKNKYAFILEGFEKEWNYVGPKRSATYTNLDPGEYIFRVKASNNDGIWNEEGASIRILILPPWWKTTWARTLYFLLILTTLYFLRKYTIISTIVKKQLWLEYKEKEKSEELNRLKIQFFTNVSHELRTPLTLIMSPLEHMLKSERLNPDFKNQLQLIYRNADRLSRLVNDLMDFTKIEYNKLILSTQPDDVVLFTKEIYNSFSEIATRSQIEYTFSCEHKSTTLCFDPDKLEKIMLNLLSNAFNFSSSGGKITVSLETISREDHASTHANEYVKISVIDNGPGIPPEHLDKIFDRFYQIPENKQHHQSGTGIGLALVKSLVELHRGRITVTSEPYKETCFSVFLPFSTNGFIPDESIRDNRTFKEKFAPKTDLNPESSPQKSVALKSGKPLLLIVEDNYELRKYMVSHLQKDYRIIEAENGGTGYEKILETFPDLVISDIIMNEVTGIELCRKVKENISTSHIPIVLLTAKATINDKIEGIETGADAYITKPFNLEYLRITVRKIIETRKKLYKRFSQDVYIIPREISGNYLDQKFLEKAIDYIQQNLTDTELSVENLAYYLLMSRSQAYRKIKALTGQSVTEFIRTIRLKMAIALLEEGKLSISEIGFKVGFTSPAYFTKCFRLQFGRSPSEYITNSGKEIAPS